MSSPRRIIANAAGRYSAEHGGLDYTYLTRRLEQWAEGYHWSLEHPMPHIATQLSRDQIEELASYLSFVR